MKYIVYTILLLVSVACNRQTENNKAITKNTPQKKESGQTKEQKADSLRTLIVFKEKLAETYNLLQLKELVADSLEAYRLIVRHGWGQNYYGGKITSITVHKTKDTCYTVIQDLYNTDSSTAVYKKTIFIPESNFDSIKALFDNSTFWSKPMTVFYSNEGSLGIDGPSFFFEAVKGGKHKIYGLTNREERILTFNRGIAVIFYHFSKYSQEFEEDYSLIEQEVKTLEKERTVAQKNRKMIPSVDYYDYPYHPSNCKHKNINSYKRKPAK